MAKRNKTAIQSANPPSNIAAQNRKQREFFNLAERLRSATDTRQIKRLGDRMGRFVFGG
jgi:hypothetical protein